MYAIVDYERKHGGIILDSSQRPANIVTIKGESSRNPDIETNAFCFPVSNIHTSSPEYLYIMEKKAHLVVRMLENRQVLLSLLTILQFLIPKKGCSTAKGFRFLHSLLDVSYKKQDSGANDSCYFKVGATAAVASAEQAAGPRLQRSPVQGWSQGLVQHGLEHQHIHKGNQDILGLLPLHIVRHSLYLFFSLFNSAILFRSLPPFFIFSQSSLWRARTRRCSWTSGCGWAATPSLSSSSSSTERETRLSWRSTRLAIIIFFCKIRYGSCFYYNLALLI